MPVAFRRQEHVCPELDMTVYRAAGACARGEQVEAGRVLADHPPADLP